jgi:hypothetical protein
MEMHPNHVRFVTQFYPYEFDDLFAALDPLEPEFRDEAMGFTYLHVIGHDAEPNMGRASRAEWRACYSYERFKATCREWAGGDVAREGFLVRSVVSETLLQLFRREDPDGPTERPGELEEWRDRVARDQAVEAHPLRRAGNQIILDLANDLLEMRKEPRPSMPPMYRRFCETVLPVMFRRMEGTSG